MRGGTVAIIYPTTPAEDTPMHGANHPRPFFGVGIPMSTIAFVLQLIAGVIVLTALAGFGLLSIIWPLVVRLMQGLGR